MSSRLSPFRRIRPIGGVVASVALLAGCSVGANLTASPSTSRMVRPTDVPTVDDPGTEQATPAAAEESYTTRPLQLWVRNVAFDARAQKYTITVASARDGRFSLRDAQPSSGTDMTDAERSCRVASSPSLQPRIKGAVATTDTLYTLTCPGTVMNLPVLQGNWDNGTSGGGTEAVLVVGGNAAQGVPDAPDKQYVSSGGAIPEVSVESHTVNAKTVSIVVWATQGSILRLEPTNPEGTYTESPCEVSPTGKHRPGTHGPPRLAQYRMRCSDVASVATMSVSASYATGKPGKTTDSVSYQSPLVGNGR